MLQKLEEEARNHIRIEQQLKLHIDTLQEKIEEKEKTEEQLKNELLQKTEMFNNLKEKAKEYAIKYNKLRQMMKGMDNTIDNSKSKSTIDESVKKPHVNISHSKNANDPMKKVIFIFIIGKYDR